LQQQAKRLNPVGSYHVAYNVWTRQN
jgi:hypothetical protein